jgi:four helix bundle protein
MPDPVRCFEDLVAWKKARLLTAAIYRATNEGEFARDFKLRDQIRGAAVSVMSNSAEGYERYSPADFCNFLRIARASCAEVRSQLYVALDVGYLAEGCCRELQELAAEVGRVIGALRASVERHRESS